MLLKRFMTFIKKLKRYLDGNLVKEIIYNENGIQEIVKKICDDNSYNLVYLKGTTKIQARFVNDLLDGNMEIFYLQDEK